MRALTDLCLDELALAGGSASEIAAVIGEDEQKVAKALCKLRTQGRVDFKVLDVARRVYFYFLPAAKKKRKAAHAKGRKPRVAGHVYFGQMRW